MGKLIDKYGYKTHIPSMSYATIFLSKYRAFITCVENKGFIF